MNCYIFIAMSICDIGGSEQYINNKKKYLKECGFDVFVFSGLTRNVLIEGLKDDKKYIIPSLMYSPCYFSKREKRSIVSRISQIVHPQQYRRILIESDGIDEAEWGEIIARFLNAKHIVLNVQEKHNYSNPEVRFLDWKYHRHELYGITKESVDMMIHKKNSNKLYNTVFDALCSNVVEDGKNPYSRRFISDADLSIGSIGRLEKEYVIPMLNRIIEYASLHNSMKFNLVLIGGSKEKRIISNIVSTVKKQKNINLIITGLLFPIPRDLLRACDLFISTSGSASVTYNEEIPTIKIHPVSAKPCGIVGLSFDLEIDSMYNTLDDTSYEELINQIAHQKSMIIYPADPYKQYFQKMSDEFDRQLGFFEYSNSKRYYNVSIINKKPNSLKVVFYYLLGRVLGGRRMQIVLEEIRKVLK